MQNRSRGRETEVLELSILRGRKLGQGGYGSSECKVPPYWSLVPPRWLLRGFDRGEVPAEL